MEKADGAEGQLKPVFVQHFGLFAQLGLVGIGVFGLGFPGRIGITLDGLLGQALGQLVDGGIVGRRERVVEAVHQVGKVELALH